MTKRILFLTGTRADFGKLKSLIKSVESSIKLNATVFVTGMHMLSKYGSTALEVEKEGFKDIFKYINQNTNDSMDVILAKTVQGLSDYVKESKPDAIVVHGDRVEALAGAIVGALNNIIVAHIEGGELSGTIDELIRHSVSKMSHAHFVANEDAKKRLIQLGELSENVFVIGSPDIDVMRSKNLPTLEETKHRYGIDFEEYGILMYHPVTTEVEQLGEKVKNLVDGVLESNQNYIVVYPNNDHGTDIVLKEIERLHGNPRFKIFPSIRFEYFLTLLKNCKFIIGNSSAGIREVPYYGKPTINLGSRQKNRAFANTIINIDENKTDILNALRRLPKVSKIKFEEFGNGKSSELFLQVLHDPKFWGISSQKQFVDLD